MMEKAPFNQRSRKSVPYLSVVERKSSSKSELRRAVFLAGLIFGGLLAFGIYALVTHFNGQ